LVKKHKRIKLPEYETQYLTVDDWEFTFSFGINNTNFDLGYYSEYNELIIYGKIITEGFKYHPAYELIIIGDTLLDCHNDLQKNHKGLPISVGSLQADKEKSTHIFLSIPQRSLNLLIPALIANKFQEIYLYCTKIKWKKASIVNYHLSTKITDEEDK